MFHLSCFHSNKYRVGQREEDQPQHMEGGGGGDEPHPQVVMQPLPAAANQNQASQCTGYVSVKHTTCHIIPAYADPSVTPVTLPFSTHPPSLPAPPTTVLDIGRTSHKRPGQLFIRSHSYHAGTTRTPPA